MELGWSWNATGFFSVASLVGQFGIGQGSQPVRANRYYFTFLFSSKNLRTTVSSREIANCGDSVQNLEGCLKYLEHSINSMLSGTYVYVQNVSSSFSILDSKSKTRKIRCSRFLTFPNVYFDSLLPTKQRHVFGKGSCLNG